MQGMAALPVLPLCLPPGMSGHGIVPPPPSASATEHRQHQQALSAATAAAAVASSIYGSPMMLPPSVLPPGDKSSSQVLSPVKLGYLEQGYSGSLLLESVQISRDQMQVVVQTGEGGGAPA